MRPDTSSWSPSGAEAITAPGPGLQWYWRADFVNVLSDDAIARHVQYGAQIPTLHSTMHFYPISGAAHRVGTQDTAFSYGCNSHIDDGPFISICLKQ